MTTEADVVQGLATGALQSPQAYCGTTYVLLRISGVGAAYRPSKDEFVWRDPSIWLSPEMCGRWAGAPLIISHPPSGLLDGDSFVRTTVGTIVRAFPRGGELWGVGRIVDGDTAAALAEHGADTSPAVLFEKDQIAPIMLAGDAVLVERSPILVDHVALVPKGVWSKGGKPGVENGKEKST